MKKTICFFIILVQVLFVSVYASDENTKTNIVPLHAATVQADQQQPVDVSEKVEKTKPAAIKTKKEVKSKEVKQQASEKLQEGQDEEARATVVLRERVSDQNPLRKIARGAVNTTLGWTEIPRQMIKVNQDKGDVAGVFWGPLKGFAFFVGRTAVGLYEVTTFLLPPYKPVVKPEFIFSEEDEN